MSSRLRIHARAPRISALDGLRGVAALYVVLFHSACMLRPSLGALPRPFHLLDRVFDHGHEAVVLFIILSGFVLMLPVVCAGDASLPGGLLAYARRRSLRILPPYYAALVLSLLLAIGWQSFSRNAGVANPFVTASPAGGVISHLFLLQNFSRGWALSIDSPTWSVATECQIYLLFPLVLLPIWRRFGNVAAIVAGFSLGMVPVLLSPRGTDFSTFSPWFLGLFAIGMTVAVYAIPAKSDAAAQSSGVRYLFAAISVALIVAIAQVRLATVWHSIALWWKDVVIGASAGLFLIYLARSWKDSGPQTALHQILGSKCLFALGGFSYSLYLVHLPLLQLLDSMLAAAHVGPVAHALVLYAVGLPLALTCGYGFHLLVEGPTSLLSNLWHTTTAPLAGPNHPLRPALSPRLPSSARRPIETAA